MQIVRNRLGKLVISIYNTAPSRIGYKALVSKFGKDFYMPIHVRVIGSGGDKAASLATMVTK